MSGTLYLCATPIGNLEDITFRVLKVLKEVDLIAAEDTRHSRKLLNYFKIKTPMTSYHEFNKIGKAHELIGQMQEGKNIALITDAGTPGISDPGEELVKMAYEAGVTVSSLPGCCACITALTVSGLSTRRFSFEGFLPQNKKQQQEILHDLKEDVRTIVLYEAPHRLKRTLQQLLETLGDRNIAFCKELTKKYENIYKTTLSESVSYYEVHEPKGEYVLVIEGKSKIEKREEEQEVWKDILIETHMAQYIEKGLSKKDAMKAVAKDRGMRKREVYEYLMKKGG